MLPNYIKKHVPLRIFVHYVEISYFFLQKLMLQWPSQVFCVFFVLPEDGEAGWNEVVNKNHWQILVVNWQVICNIAYILLQQDV